jgi:hypothetical protein
MITENNFEQIRSMPSAEMHRRIGDLKQQHQCADRHPIVDIDPHIEVALSGSATTQHNYGSPVSDYPTRAQTSWLGS